MNVPFNIPPQVGCELDYIKEALNSNVLSGNGPLCIKSQKWLEVNLDSKKVLLTPSCTAALEMSALLIDTQPGDEIIMPSYTFVSTANAFVLRGAKIVFVDICPVTMNINTTLIEAAISPKTKAIVPVHYAGVACDMDKIMALATQYNLFVIEDAAQAIGSFYKGKALGTIGHLGTLSFHETKNITSGGEGGALLINDGKFIDRAEIIREKGTNRCKFLRGDIDKYSWVDLGSSYLPSEIQAAYLYAQLLNLKDITADRVKSWNSYYEKLSNLALSGLLELPQVPSDRNNNGHIFYVKVKSLTIRSQLLEHLCQKDVSAVFHYVPLHSSEAGIKYGRFSGEDIFTTIESERIIRLPLYYGISTEDIIKVSNEIISFYMHSPVTQ